MSFPMSADAAASHPNDMAPTMSAAQHRIPRPGKRPLVFSGSELAMAMSFSPELPYWYEINIFRTDDQRFALVIKQFYQAEDMDDWSKGWIFETLPDVFDTLEAYDAAKDIRLGVPETETAAPAELIHMALELKAQVQSRRAHFASLIGEMFAELELAGQGMA